MAWRVQILAAFFCLPTLIAGVFRTCHVGILTINKNDLNLIILLVAWTYTIDTHRPAVKSLLCVA